MENDIEQARASNMEIEQARASNMENDIEQARASNMEEDKYIEMATDILKKLDNEITSISKKKSMSSKGSSYRKPISHCCIYRVPQALRDVNSKAYTPALISIGPFHRGNQILAMGREKLRYFEKLTERNGMDKKKRCDIVISIKNQEDHLRYCYSEKFYEIKSNDFVEMILLDAVFIIEFFLESNDVEGPRSFSPRSTFEIREDLMLLENQLPLSIIEKIYDQVSYHHSSDNKHTSFLDLATCYLIEYLQLQGCPDVDTQCSSDVETECRFDWNLRSLRRFNLDVMKEPRHFTDLLRNLMLCKTSQGVETETSSDVETEFNPYGKKEPRHLTDLLRNLMLSRAIPRRYSPDLVKLKYSAIMLRKAGVRFQVTEDECLVNIKFDKGVLKIPHLKVDHHFVRLVRNIMAMEQCLYEHEAYICSYIKFMDHLIDSAGDVDLLVENRIIYHRLNDDAAFSNMINNLCKNIGDNDTCFGNISQELNAHYENSWNHRKATLKHVYFPNIWRGTGTVAAAILLILTLMQTIKAFL